MDVTPTYLHASLYAFIRALDRLAAAQLATRYTDYSMCTYIHMTCLLDHAITIDSSTTQTFARVIQMHSRVHSKETLC